MISVDAALRREAPALSIAPQFADASQQREAATLGMWIFLATEVMFFGALFFAYAIARFQFPEAFAAASRHTSIVLGTTNTGVLLTSSLAMALAVRSAAHGARRGTAALLAITGLLGLAFAGIKVTEYVLDYRDHLVPGADFAFDPRYARGAMVFFGLYFATTGLHLLHLSVGVALVAVFAWRVWRVKPNALADQVEIVGLYWHFVDVVWIFLYPCLYLVSRA
ncbi:MAG: cytochrome c oxidase subunit 3 [Rudaea sp.]